MDNNGQASRSHKELWSTPRDNTADIAVSTPPPESISHDLPVRASSDSRTAAVDAEDEDVKIAIMALGAMKNLDGSSNALTSSTSTTRKSRTSSAISNSSFTSTAISSPSSTPATEVTHESAAPAVDALRARLGNLPPDFQLPAVIQDEDGNELQVDSELMNDADFLQRVSHLPIVRGTLRAYELGKQKSKVVKYGADLVENSVRSISRPVVSRLGASLGERGVGQLDDFACRQLDRLYPTAVPSPTKEEQRQIFDRVDRKDQQEWRDLSSEEREKRKTAYTALQLEQRERALMLSELRQRKGTVRDGEEYDSLTEQDLTAASAGAIVQASQGQPQLLKGSRWGSMLVEAGATAGGLSAAMSQESMKSLKYCLQWLQYATAHIEHQITILRDLIVRLNHGELDMSGTAVENLSNIKGDVVNTIRGVVDVIGKYAGSALPEPARNSVKAFILSLPARWATVNRSSAATTPNGYFGSSPSSPSFSPSHFSSGPQSPLQLATTSARHRSSGKGTPREQMEAAATAQAANRILTLAIESLDILRSVTVVFGESLDRADLWVERLRILGLQRKRQHDEMPFDESQQQQQITAGGSSSMHWESARGSSMYGRAGSPSGDSDASMGTTSSKRRRRTTPRQGRSPTRGGAFHMSRTPSAQPPATTSDDENLTETEKLRSSASSSNSFSSTQTQLAGSRRHVVPPSPATSTPTTRSRANTGSSSSKLHPMHPPTNPSPLHTSSATHPHKHEP